MEAPSLRHAELLRTGLVDIGLARDPEPSRGVVNLSIVSERLMVALPSEHPLGRLSWINPGALNGEPFVLFARKAHAGLHDRLFGVFRDAGFEPHIVQEASDWLTATALVQAGLGITIVPESFSRIQNKAVCHRRLRSPVRTEIVVCHRDEPLSPVGREFLKASHRVGAGAAR
jgi:DNA-binding transcriptional LysR family regulator